MQNKVILVLVDGMRPDGIEQCGNPYLMELKQKSTSCFSTQTIMPSYTLPCHTSLFLSVGAERHGITTNNWMPQVRPIDSLGDIVYRADKKAAMFYNWEQLRDLNQPGSLHFSHFQRQVGECEEVMESEVDMTKKAIEYILKESPDFVFIYLGFTDEAGHKYGWMNKEYLAAISTASDCIHMIQANLSQEYQLIVTADHGGHQCTHGLNLPEDMTIPLIMNGSCFESGKELNHASIKDIAPTIATILELSKPREWEGDNLSMVESL